jgi:thiol-disulfide isomerase/thioredoxin
MKKIFVVLFVCLLSASAFAQKVAPKFVPDKSKPVLLVFTADWCAPCEAMKKEVFTVDSVSAAMSGYNVLLVDVDTPLGSTYQERFCGREVQIPYFVVLDRAGAVKGHHLGAMQADQFLKFLGETGTMTSAGQAPVGGLKYVNVPDRENYRKGWEFEGAVGGAISSATDTSATKPGFVIAGGVRYRASKLVAIRSGVDAVIVPGAVGYIPSFTVAVPLDIELYLLDNGYGFAGTFWGYHSAPKIKGIGDVGFRLGAGYKISDFDIRLTYNLGILNLNKGDIVNRASANALTFTVGYCF